MLLQELGHDLVLLLELGLELGDLIGRGVFLASLYGALYLRKSATRAANRFLEASAEAPFTYCVLSR